MVEAAKLGQAAIVHMRRSAQRRRRSVKMRRCLPNEALIVQANPAILSIALGSVFPDAAVVAELRGPGEISLLLPAEAAYLGRSVPKRAREFAAGRLCARRALAEFGMADFPIKVAADRRPLWPPSIVGSITHTDGFCAAVVAERSSLVSIGIDSERAESVKPELWESICVADEIAWLNSLAGTQRRAAATLMFSAKEAFYKCQYPLTLQFLGFLDVQVQLPDWGAERGIFTIAANRDIAVADHAVFPMCGRYLFHEQFVTASLCLPAAPAKIPAARKDQ
jgi:4'-phosphopantetheinyl transferase EntD